MPLFRNPSKEPLWKDEFSVFTSDERYVTRRQFTKFLTLASLRDVRRQPLDSGEIASYQDSRVSNG